MNLDKLEKNIYRCKFFEVQLIYNIVLVSSVQQSDSVFLQTLLCYKILALFPALYSIFLQLIYFIHGTLYFLIPYSYLVLPPLSSLVTTLNFFFNYSRFAMFCQFLLYRKVTQLYIYIHSFFFHFILHQVPSQMIRYSSLCYIAGSHYLSIPNAIVCIYCKLPLTWQPQVCSSNP